MFKLFRSGAKTKSVPEEQLPALHSFVDVTVMGRSARSVSVEQVGPNEIAVGGAVGRAGDRAVFVYQNPEGRFRFGATITQVANDVTYFKMPERVEPIGSGAQKRSSVRMDVLVPGFWRVAAGGAGTGEFQKGSIRDISRGGCSLITDRQFKPGQSLEIRMDLRGDAGPVTVLGEVMRVDVIPTSGKFSHGMRFQRLTAEEDGAILDFIHKKQADLRNRGLA